MKKLAYLLATAALAACSGNPNGYTIKGSIAGATDGEMVYLQKVEGRQYVALDSAIIANEAFTFEGVQAPAAYRYLTYDELECGQLSTVHTVHNCFFALQISLFDR
jgi:hypothetical protein